MERKIKLQELSPLHNLIIYGILKLGSTSQVEGYMSTGDIVEAKTRGLGRTKNYILNF